MIPFSPPRIDEKVIDAVSEVLRSGWITTGPRTKEFEKKIADYCGVPTVICLNSATAGLELVLRWFGVSEGDEVILPAYTYCATANVVLHCKARPVMVDIGDDFTINVENIRQAITSRTKVIMPVDIAGYPCDYDAIYTLVEDAAIKSLFRAATSEQESLGRILVMADAAHSFGAVYHGKRSGSLTDISVFSFHAVKNLTTAEGGAICLNLPPSFDQENLYRYFCRFSLHGQSKDALSKLQVGNWKYDVLEAGFKCNMTDIQAAIGLVELSRYEEEMLPRRRFIFERYSEAFSRDPRFRIPEYVSVGRTSSYHLYPLRIRDITEEQRDRIIERIFEQEVAVNVHFIPLPLLTCYRELGYDIKDYPATYDNYACEISLPVYYTLSDEQVEKVIDAVIKSVNTVL